ncbi:hypothetical protein ACFXHA_29085 [Nocardia sp. NPDC059240]|uniref:hypothetical protein n=1 Tax=Nocardia sp. NPDC059240 TaxID=3346786 RepID=UPI0036CF4943
MSLRISGRAITSDMTPETAHLVPGPRGGAWVLSWLPGWDLTQEQAIDGMALDEMLSDPSAIEGELALELATLRAESIGLGLEDVVVRLAARIFERDRIQHPQARADSGAGDSPARSALGPAGAHAVGPQHRGPWPRWMRAGGTAWRRLVVALLWAGYNRRHANSLGSQESSALR